MEKTFTQNDLLQFIYGESSAQDSEMIQYELIVNEDFNQEFEKLLEAVDMLKTNNEKPNLQMTTRLTNFSKSIETRQSRYNTCKLLWILN